MGDDRFSKDDLDLLLGLQLTVAWSGESAGEPRRMGWWSTDMVDREGGGDLLVRLVPRTAAWAGLELARAAAIASDQRARARLAEPDRVQTLFHWGFAIDEQLLDRLRAHKRPQVAPREVFERTLLSGWSKDAFAQFLSQFGEPKVEVIPGARRIKAPADALGDRAGQLMAALLPLSDTYPLPFIEVSA
jgi:hypothetical protein